MAVVHEFQYYRPEKLDEVLVLLARQKEKARILAGGTDLAVYIKEGLDHPQVVIDVKHVSELKKIEYDNNSLFIGALATFSDILANEHIKMNYLMLWESAQSVASMGIRNRATLVGNICSAVPSLDSAPALLCYDAIVHTHSLEGTRSIPIREWFVSPRKTAKAEDEIVMGVTIPKIAAKHAGCYLKLGRYRGEDLAQAGLGVLLTEEKHYRIAYCAVGPIPKRVEEIENLLNGKTLNEAIVKEAKGLVPQLISPITDIRSSKEYRTHMCQVMLERGLQAATDRLQGKTVDSTKVLGG
ncbi:MAG TPA: xanthine dehydrogenase family protein subunit M [Candidatus Cloacimonadota bacterium]|nr:xanthine dehydrogenase family protein subunit M [Candidatus Cloacimonadota bacterium]HPT71721.1 xanthine dehydrogenase family protein subunit M [Candidatus Cloacimonadota bacterium]